MRLYHMDLKFTMYKKEYIKKWFEKLKTNGFDGVVVEIDNKLIFPSHPDFAAKDALTADEWNDIVKFGKNLGLIVYPLLQTLGHMEHILEIDGKYDHLAENPGKSYMLCPSKSSTINFIKDLIKDLIDVFNKPEIIHLGGDEVYGHMDWKGIKKCPICMHRDSGELLNNYLLNLAKFCIGQGVRPEFWADEILTFPEHIDKFPKSTRFVDWYYSRTERYSNAVGLVWGARNLMKEPITENFADKVPEHLKCLLPYVINEDNKFNNFYGAEYIISKGYESVIASGVRFSGDCYAVPRIDAGSENVKISEAVSREINCDHLVTSWAVRLSHPETTWPSLRAINYAEQCMAKDRARSEGSNNESKGTDENGIIDENITAPLGNITHEQMMLLKDVSGGILGIDIMIEQNARFERPYYDDYSKRVYDIWAGDNKNEIIEMLKKRISSGKQILPVLHRNLNEEKGDSDCIRHWINGIELCILRSEQVIAIVDSYTNGVNKEKMKELLERNKKLMNDFDELWSESITEYSLEQEKEVKFKRDIRMLENLLCE
ncbi:MAG: family 20 glycosylhydrolase [Clostridiaceae bacterium]|nr:family 20 glycosylhydrolase [Clostridiaceae bacterium]